MQRIYLDHNATSPMQPEVLEETIRVLKQVHGNPSSIHTEGQRANQVLERARKAVAKTIAAAPQEIVFTSGGTESIVTALAGVFSPDPTTTNQNGLLTSHLEHQAVRNTSTHLVQRGVHTSWVQNDEHGVVDLCDLTQAMNARTRLCSIMLANNEVGTIQPIAQISALAHQQGSLCHTDAVQGLGKLPLDIKDTGVDLASFSAHKIGAPKGVGALYIKHGTPLFALLHGGHQENQKRAGTQNLPAIAGFAKACQIATDDLTRRQNYLRSLRDAFESLVMSGLADVDRNGHPTQRLVNTSNITFHGVDGTLLLLNLDTEGIAASGGSACNAGSDQPSHVLVALGLTETSCLSSVRFSFGMSNTLQEAEQAAEIVIRLVKQLRS